LLFRKAGKIHFLNQLFVRVIHSVSGFRLCAQKMVRPRS
jgi:hypothetical protein